MIHTKNLSSPGPQLINYRFYPLMAWDLPESSVPQIKKKTMNLKSPSSSAPTTSVEVEVRQAM